MNTSEIDSDKPDKFAIAQNLRDICSLLKLKAENKYRANAYENAATALEGISEDLSTMIKEARLTEVRNIGNSIAQVINEIYETGTTKMLDKLKAQYPPGMIEIGAVPGLSVKTIEALHEALAITSLADLKRACNNSVVRTVKGFGEKSERSISEAIAVYEARRNKIRLVDAFEWSHLLLQHMNNSPFVRQAELAGQMSRWEEAVDSIDVVASGENIDQVLDAFSKFPYLSTLESRQADCATARLSESGSLINLYVCEPNEFVCTSHFRSATAPYNDKLSSIAAARGFQLNSKELTENGRRVSLKSDEDIYQKLALPYIPVELREDSQVLEDALSGTTYDDLIKIEDIRGMTHCHSTYSDGVATVEEMVKAAQALNKEYITITDHSPTAHYANGVPPERLLAQWQEIAAAQSSTGLVVFRGTESDILADGSLDYPDAILNQLDVIIASIHARLKMDEEQMTNRLIGCMRQKQFKIWGHALGRLVLKRDPIACRVEEVIDIASQSRVAIEVNGDPHRLDMEPKWLRLARKKKMKFVISTDAHSTRDMLNLKFGVHLARRAGMRKSEVLNTLSAEKFREAVKPC